MCHRFRSNQERVALFVSPQAADDRVDGNETTGSQHVSGLNLRVVSIMSTLDATTNELYYGPSRFKAECMSLLPPVTATTESSGGISSSWVRSCTINSSRSNRPLSVMKKPSIAQKSMTIREVPKDWPGTESSHVDTCPPHRTDLINKVAKK